MVKLVMTTLTIEITISITRRVRNINNFVVPPREPCCACCGSVADNSRRSCNADNPYAHPARERHTTRERGRARTVRVPQSQHTTIDDSWHLTVSTCSPLSAIDPCRPAVATGSHYAWFQPQSCHVAPTPRLAPPTYGTQALSTASPPPLSTPLCSMLTAHVPIFTCASPSPSWVCSAHLRQALRRARSAASLAAPRAAQCA
jgi:hypothetical protein